MPDDAAGRPLRVFFALWPDLAAQAALHRAALTAGRQCGGRVMRRQNLHLTLAFVGDVAPQRLPELQALAAEVAAPAFRLDLDRLGYWPHNHILWAGSGAASPALGELAGQLAARLRAAGWPTGLKAGQAFVPHVTLLRKVDAHPAALPAFSPLAWECESFALMRSCLSASGAVYENIGKWPLRRV